MKKRISILISIILIGILSPSFALAEKVSLDGAIPTTSDLVKNCVAITTKADKDNKVDISPGLKLVYVWGTGTVIEYLGSTGLIGPYQAAKNFYACGEPYFSEIQITSSSLTTIPRLILSATNNILWVITWGVKLVLRFLGGLLITMVAQGKYITNPIVTSGWPFIQGIANLGFIIALLYIAFATTLRLDSVATSVQRLLPKLLIAALLVNFSLVIGGLFIDMSRVVMAVEINLMGDGKITGDNFTDKLVASTEAVTAEVAGLRNQGTNNSFLAIMVRLFQNTFFVLVLTIGIGVIAINLLVRYIALIILLMVSPLAYLALALPKTANYASMWWGMFIKWVLYGPIVLFFLLLIIRVQNIAPSLPQGKDAAGADSWIPFFNATLHFIIVIALFFVANTLGKKVAGIGSDTAMGFANKTGAWAKKNPKKAAFAALALSGAPGAGLAAAAVMGGGQMAATGAYSRGRDFAKGLYKPIQKFAGTGDYNLYDEKGQLKQGKTSLGSRTADSVKSYLSGDSAKQNKTIADQKDLYNALKDKSLYKPGFEAKDLTNASFVAKLDDATLKAIVDNGDSGQVAALAAAIAKDTNGTIGDSKLKEIIGHLDKTSNANNQQVVIRGISQNAKTVKGLKGDELGKILKHAEGKQTESILKAIATVEKK